MEEAKPQIIKIGGLWQHETKGGIPFMSGNFGLAQIQIWPNKKRDGKNDPDFNIVICDPMKKKETNYNTDFKSNASNADIPF